MQSRRLSLFPASERSDWTWTGREAADWEDHAALSDAGGLWHLFQNPLRALTGSQPTSVLEGRKADFPRLEMVERA